MTLHANVLVFLSHFITHYFNLTYFYLTIKWKSLNHHKLISLFSMFILFSCLGQPSFLKSKSLSSINLWMNSTRSRSSTHYDPYHNILCVVAGCKQGIMYINVNVIIANKSLVFIIYTM